MERVLLESCGSEYSSGRMLGYVNRQVSPVRERLHHEHCSGLRHPDFTVTAEDAESIEDALQALLDLGCVG